MAAGVIAKNHHTRFPAMEIISFLIVAVVSAILGRLPRFF